MKRVEKFIKKKKKKSYVVFGCGKRKAEGKGKKRHTDSYRLSQIIDHVSTLSHKSLEWMIWPSVNTWHKTDNGSILWRSIESTTCPPWDMCHHGVREHVDAQRGSNGDDDARGDWDPTAPTHGPHSIQRWKQVLQGSGSGGDILCCHRRDEHAYGDRCQCDIGGHVEELFPSRRAYQLQHMVLLWFPSGFAGFLCFVGYSLFSVLLKGFRAGPQCLFGQSPFEEGAWTVG